MTSDKARGAPQATLYNSQDEPTLRGDLKLKRADPNFPHDFPAKNARVAAAPISNRATCEIRTANVFFHLASGAVDFDVFDRSGASKRRCASIAGPIELSGGRGRAARENRAQMKSHSPRL